MPETAKGEKIKANMEREYGAKKGEQIFYASANKGTITGVHDAAARMDASLNAMTDACRVDAHEGEEYDMRTGKWVPAKGVDPDIKRKRGVREEPSSGLPGASVVKAYEKNREANPRWRKGDAAKLDASISAMCDACGIADDRRVVGGVMHSVPASNEDIRGK